MATEGQKSVRDNIISIFGANQISKLVDVNCITPDEAILTEYNIQLKSTDEIPFNFEFLISTIEHGNGRSAPDRQFYYINDRPCELSKLIKLVNEIYRQFNCNQYPFVYLNVKTKTSLVDVNVTPDKRQIFIEQEKILLATVKASLLDIFKTFPSTYKLQNLNVSNMLKDRGIKRSLTDSVVKKGIVLDSFRKRSKTEENVTKSYSCDLKKFFNKSEKIEEPEDSFIECKYEAEEVKNEKIVNKPNEDYHESNKFVQNDKLIAEKIKKDNKINTINIDKSCQDFPQRSSNLGEGVDVKKLDYNTAEDSPEASSSQKSNDINHRVKTDNPSLKKVAKKISLGINLDDIRNKLSKRAKDTTNIGIKVRFRSEIDNKNAEDELKKHILKSDFKNMSIIGQFNLGFIVTKLNNDLFIVDQHASDEKYNFEQLQATTVLENQKLVKFVYIKT